MKHYGIPEEDASAKRGGWDHYGEWRQLHLVSLRIQPDGSIEIASYPTGKRLDLMMGSRLEVELFPDGTYSAEISPQWVVRKEGRIGKHALETGCYLHPSCEDCSEPDCAAKDYLLVQPRR